MNQRKKLFAILALVFGGLGLLLCWLPFVGLIFGLVGLVFVILAWLKKQHKVLKIIGTVLVPLALLIGIGQTIISVSLTNSFNKHYPPVRMSKRSIEVAGALDPEDMKTLFSGLNASEGTGKNGGNVVTLEYTFKKAQKSLNKQEVGDFKIIMHSNLNGLLKELHVPVEPDQVEFVFKNPDGKVINKILMDN